MSIVLLSFSESLATNCVSLNNEPCMARPFLIDLNPLEFNNYPFTVTLDKCSGRCNAANDLSTKICVLSKTRNVNVKAFNIMTRINDATTMVKHISRDCKWKFNSTACNSNQKWNHETC